MFNNALMSKDLQFVLTNEQKWALRMRLCCNSVSCFVFT